MTWWEIGILLLAAASVPSLIDLPGLLMERGILRGVLVLIGGVFLAFYVATLR